MKSGDMPGEAREPFIPDCECRAQQCECDLSVATRRCCIRVPLVDADEVIDRWFMFETT